MSSVHLRGTSTETVPNTNASGGSVVADLNGLAVKVKPSKVASFTRSTAGYQKRRVVHLPSLLSAGQGGRRDPAGMQHPALLCLLLHWSPVLSIPPQTPNVFPLLCSVRFPLLPGLWAMPSPSQFIVFRSGFLNPEQHAQKIHVLPPVFSSVQGSSC